MSRVIDTDTAYEVLTDYYHHRLDEQHNALRDALSRVPTADVVEVVRCKDCRWGKESCGNIECFADTNVPPEYHGYDWFCPNGERKA